MDTSRLSGHDFLISVRRPQNEQPPDPLVKLIITVMIQDPRRLCVKDLHQVFVDTCHEFISRLQNCKDAEDLELLQDLHLYLKALSLQIENRNGYETAGDLHPPDAAAYLSN
jgi:hypothetical protein